MTQETTPASAPPGRRLPPGLEPLRLPGFRNFMVIMVFFTAAIQLEIVAQGWLVYHITQSNLALGIVASMWNVTLFAFSPLGGAIADRVDKRRLVMVTWAVATVIYMAVTLLIWTDRIEVWHLVIVALLAGILFAFNIPARVALISQLVGDTRLMGSMALISMAFNLSGVLFPIVGGLLIDWVGGAAGAYGLIAVFYVVVTAMAFLLPAGKAQVTSERGSVVGDFLEGLRFVRAERRVAWLLALAVAAVVLGQSFGVLLPGFAAETLNVPASGLGLLFSAMGLGAFAGNFLVASLAGRPGLGRWMFVMGAASGLGIVALALTRSIYPALAVLFLLGLTVFPFTTVNQTLVQLLAPLRLRGRVQSLYMLTWASMPVGSVILSALADRVGARVPLLVAGLVLTAVMVFVAWSQRGLLGLPLPQRGEATPAVSSALVSFPLEEEDPSGGYHPNPNPSAYSGQALPPPTGKGDRG